MRRWEPTGLPLAKIRSVAELLGKNPLVLADIGAAGPLAMPFRTLSKDQIITLRFDPRPNAINSSKSKHEYVVGSALGETAGTLQLFETATGDSSSVFPPHDAVLRNFLFSQGSKPRQVVKVDTVHVDSFDALVALGDIPTPNVLKIDTQGSELPILKGSEGILDNVQLIMVETWTHEVYEGISLDSELTSFLENRGFKILDVVVAARWKFAESDGLLGVLDHGVVTGFEKIFVKLDAESAVQELHLAVLLDLFGFKAKALALMKSRMSDGEIWWFQARNFLRPSHVFLRLLAALITRFVRLA